MTKYIDRPYAQDVTGDIDAPIFPFFPLAVIIVLIIALMSAVYTCAYEKGFNAGKRSNAETIFHGKV